MPLAVQPQRQAAVLPASHVIPPELLPVLENSAISHPNLHCFPVSRKTRPEQTAGKDAFVAGLRSVSQRTDIGHFDSAGKSLDLEDRKIVLRPVSHTSVSAHAPKRALTGFGEHPNRKCSSAKPLQNSQFLQWLACHRFGWTFLAAKISRKSPNF